MSEWHFLAIAVCDLASSMHGATLGDLRRKRAKLGVLLLENFKTFSRGSSPQKTQQLHDALDDCITQLRRADALPMLGALKDKLQTKHSILRRTLDGIS